MKVIIVTTVGDGTRQHRVIDGVTAIREYPVYVYFQGPALLTRTSARRDEIVEMQIEVTP